MQTDIHGKKPKTKKPVRHTIPLRERILVAAGDLFHKQGIRGVGVEAIAEAAQTNKMTLYRYFASKDELITEWVRGMIAYISMINPKQGEPLRAAFDALGAK